MEIKVSGRAIKLGDHISTDLIYPGKFLNISDPEEIARHSLQGISSDFPGRLEKGCFVVAGVNFGCGSSREQAVVCLKYAGVAAVIAKGFARIFYRNAINQAFPIVQCPEAVDVISDGQIIEVNFLDGKIITRTEEFSFNPLPEFILEIFRAGGLLNYTRNLIQKSPR
jgi:3-isopropylmalate/(R)-2-methylmalate dehydratase small subunit